MILSQENQENMQTTIETDKKKKTQIHIINKKGAVTIFSN